LALTQARTSTLPATSSPTAAPGTPAFPVLLRDAAELLVDRGVALLGTDASGFDAESYPIHRGLLGAGRVQCVFLPLAVIDTDGAPVRAIAWRRQAKNPSYLTRSQRLA